MRNTWRTYLLLSVMTLCSIYTQGMVHSAIAQQTEQPQAVVGGEAEDLKWQLKQMEESFAKQQEQMKQFAEIATKQQEQIQVLRNRIDTMSSQTTTAKAEGVSPTLAKKEEIKQVVDYHLSTDEARKKMALGMPAMTTIYTPDEEKLSIGFKSADDNYSLGIGFRMQFRYTFKDEI